VTYIGPGIIGLLVTLHNSTRAPLLLILLSSAAAAQTARSVDEPPPINDPAPRSPIDRGRHIKTAEEIAKEEKAAVVTPPLPPRKPSTVWLGWTFGSGYGWHPERPLDGSNAQVDAGFGAGSLGHFGLEVGWQRNERLSLSLQGRHQIIPRKDTDQTRPGTSPQWAHSVLAKALYSFPQTRYQLFAGGALGGGQGFRFRIDPQPSRNVPSSDTTTGGPVVVGPVAGIIFPLLDRLSLVGEVRALAGIPHFGMILDVNLGLQFDTFNL
jgi:hypothetical protein